MKQLAFDFSVASPPTFGNFVAGRNGELVQRMRAAASGKGGERFVYAWGGRGSGRSHLLRAAVACAESCGLEAAYVRCETMVELGEGLHALDLVAVDDVERLAEAGQAGLFRLYNALRDNGRALLAAGPVAPTQLTLRADVVTRLAWGLVYEVHGLTDSDKVEALAERAAERGFALPADVAQYLLTHARRDMPTLLATLEALDRWSRETKRAVTLALARELLDDMKREQIAAAGKA